MNRDVVLGIECRRNTTCPTGFKHKGSKSFTSILECILCEGALWIWRGVGVAGGGGHIHGPPESETRFPRGRPCEFFVLRTFQQPAESWIAAREQQHCFVLT